MGTSLAVTALPIGILEGIVIYLSPAASSTVSWKWVIASALIGVWLLLGITVAYVKAMSLARPSIPKLRVVREISEGEYVLLFEPSDLFSYGIAVALYYRDDENFEHLIAVGRVVNIQEGGLIQVGIISGIQGYEENLNSLYHNDVAAVRRVLVKPNLPVDVMARIGAPI